MTKQICSTRLAPSGLETENIVALGILQLELEFRNVGFYGERQAIEPREILTRNTSAFSAGSRASLITVLFLRSFTCL